MGGVYGDGSCSRKRDPSPWFAQAKPPRFGTDVARFVTSSPHAHSKGMSMAKYGKKASKKVERAMRERKRGTLRSGRSGKRVTSRKQAIAIGLSEARRSGAKVPRKRGGRKK